MIINGETSTSSVTQGEYTNIKKWDDGTMRELLFRLPSKYQLTREDIIKVINKMEQEYVRFDELILKG